MPIVFFGLRGDRDHRMKVDQIFLSPGRTNFEDQKGKGTYLKPRRYRGAELCKFQDSSEDKGRVGLVVARRIEK